MTDFPLYPGVIPGADGANPFRFAGGLALAVVL